jgi:hypothetical protein
MLVCSAIWLKGLKSIWSRAALLASFLLLLFVLLPSVNQDRNLASLAIYQQEAIAFAEKVAAQLERGEQEAARKRLLYFSKNQDWKTANDPEALRAFYKRTDSAEKSTPATGAQSTQASTSK